MENKLMVKVVDVDAPQKWSFAKDPNQEHYPFYCRIEGISDLQKLTTTKPVKAGDMISLKATIKGVYVKDDKGNFSYRKIIALVPEV